MSRNTIQGALASLAVLAVSSLAHAENRTTPGDASIEPPTLISLGFDWVDRGRRQP